MLKISQTLPGVDIDAYNPSTLEAVAGGSLWVLGHPGLQSEFQDYVPGVHNEILSQIKNKANPKTEGYSEPKDYV